MAGIGGIAFDIVRGQGQDLKQVVETWTVPGQDGTGAQLLGMVGPEFEIETVVYADSNSSANAFIEDSDALQGEIVSFVDNFDDEYDNILVIYVDTTNAKKKCVFEGNANAVRVSIRWKLVKVSA